MFTPQLKATRNLLSVSSLARGETVHGEFRISVAPISKYLIATPQETFNIIFFISWLVLFVFYDLAGTLWFDIYFIRQLI